MAYITDRLVSSCARSIVTIASAYMRCVYGWAGVRHVVTKFFRMDSLSNFVTHGAPLRAQELRDNYGLFSEQNVEMGELWVNV